MQMINNQCEYFPLARAPLLFARQNVFLFNKGERSLLYKPHQTVSTRLVGVTCYDIYRKVLIIPSGIRANIVVKKLKEIHFVSQIIAVPWREELIHIGCLPFAWLYKKFPSPLLKTAASFSQPLFALFCLFFLFFSLFQHCL